MVWSSGLTPAAIIRTSTLPAANVGLGTSTSFRPPYPVNDSARIALITPPMDPCPRYAPADPLCTGMAVGTPEIRTSHAGAFTKMYLHEIWDDDTDGNWRFLHHGTCSA